MGPRAILLDRDGVINADSPNYILSPEQWEALPGSLAAIAQLNQAGMLVGVCSNQSAVGRGMMSQQTLNAIHQRMQAQLKANGAHLDAIAVCPHAPESQCDCRKPKPGLILQMLAQWNLTPDEALFIGDSQRDLDAAAAVGVEAWLVRTGNGRQTETQWCNDTQPVEVFDDLNAAVTTLLNRPIHE
ncbi:D-glycero-beta-D-manno-heptose 1,7-bisphosphate 7-phosphatase [Spiribacter sp. C176]|uniref:D,D-heptose 1,7-bisphosphate phosphatase n=1 Tax=Spiribacter salilacus TaxID=2664894 RepID=A0A6N7QSL9_9GAMM|nr:D-glycero-beta-D-manno-heptose 1,7-bisphosphate 7-phosphatase [Spiribacter salilacus]MRH78399.1 D-glycero-beta-D-manno-heptose 1,7-bisphosphate 7-phosphatase [Spiribacter salilacus]